MLFEDWTSIQTYISNYVSEHRCIMQYVFNAWFNVWITTARCISQLCRPFVGTFLSWCQCIQIAPHGCMLSSALCYWASYQDTIQNSGTDDYVPNKCNIVKPVWNDHLYNEIDYLWFIQQCVLMMTEGTNLSVLTISAFWSSSRWPRAT